MASEVYRKVGRGGAGNFWSKKDIDDAQKLASKDVEAQNPVVDLDPSSIQRREPDSVHFHGRGGAGNLSLLGTTKDDTQDASTPATETNHKISSPGYSGRGGAGNFRSGEDESKAAQEKGAELRRQREEEIEKDVEQGLKMPEKAHLWENRTAD